MNTKTTFLYVMLAVISFCGCINSEPDVCLLSDRNPKQTPRNPFTIGNSKKIFILSSEPAESMVAFQRLILWENVDGSGLGLCTWLAESLSEGVWEIYWHISPEKWHEICQVVADKRSLKQAMRNIYIKNKYTSDSLDGTFYMFSALLGDNISTFSVHTSSEYWVNAHEEKSIIEKMVDSIPLTPEYGLPDGCLYALIRKHSKEGALTSESEYWNSSGK